VNHTLSRFLEALRHAELTISPAEAIDAYRTLATVGPSDRELLRDALTVTLAKTVPDEARVEETFDRFFMPHLEDANDEGGDSESSCDEANPGTDNPNPDNQGPLDASVLEQADLGGATEMANMMLGGDTAGMTAALQGAAREVGLERMWLFTQKNQFTRRMLETLGLRDLERAMSQAERQADEGLGQQLGALRTAVFVQTRAFVEREFELFARDTARRLADERLVDAKLNGIDSRDRKRMVLLVKRLAKRLASLYSARRRRVLRGQLDVRRTMRRNHRNDDLLFNITWRNKRIDRPKVMVVCDVSRSVAAASQFLMLFVYGLSEVLRDVRSFVLCSNLVETTDIFKRAELDEAVAEALEAAILGSTDYGRGLDDFSQLALDRIDRRTTVLILGDARSNFSDPRAEQLKRIHDRARCVVWLNPEPRSFWGTGDSEMLRYLPHIDIARTVASLSDLDRAVSLMLIRSKL
jgi:uncharacterized protein with von Willebrand factor type A (vWA) domain